MPLAKIYHTDVVCPHVIIFKVGYCVIMSCAISWCSSAVYTRTAGADLGIWVGGVDIICNTYNLSATPFLQISLSAGQSWGGIKPPNPPGSASVLCIGCDYCDHGDYMVVARSFKLLGCRLRGVTECITPVALPCLGSLFA